MILDKMAFYTDYLNNLSKDEWVRRYRELQQQNIPGWEDEFDHNGEILEIPVRDGSKIPVIFYRPKNPTGKDPIYFQVHGGGFTICHASVDEHELELYRDECNMFVAGIEFKRAPERAYPEQLYDVYDVCKYFADHADEFGIDVNRMGIGGLSAGGNTSTVVCRMAQEGNDFKFKMQWIGYAAMDLYNIDPDPVIGDGGTTEEIYLLYCLYADHNISNSSYLSPALADPEELKCMPPTVYVIADVCPLKNENVTYVKKLVEAGVEVKVKTYLGGAAHGFTVKHYDGLWGNWIPESEDAMKFTIEGFKKYLL